MTNETPPPGSHIDPVNIEDEMKRSYLDYAMSVIVSRALPDVRDGLKPVQRRILYAMKVGGYEWNRQYRKSARIVGDVMGKYHPHGDSAIYDAMVRMAQPFSLRLPLIDGQGNFGSMDGDPPAAMRYTEARMARAADSLIDDIDKETVDFTANYDDTDEEPTVIPARFPNLLVNGAGGIAVGMATNIPPHNLGEVIDACCAYVDNPHVTTAELMELVPGPDFPTGGMILGKQGIQAAYEFGRGSIMMRAKTHFEEVRKDRQAIIVTEIPYQENKSRLIERIAEVARDGKVEGISDLRDESDRDGVRVVIELKRDVMGEVVLNQLFRFTPLQTSFGVNSLALLGGRPQMLNLREMIEAFVQFREEVITRRTVYELKRARERAHVLIGLAVAVANVDDVVAAIRHAKDPAEAREKLMTTPWPAGDVTPLIELVAEPGRQVGEDGNYMLSEAQARAILELRLQRLTGLERDKIGSELTEIVEQIRGYLEILASRERLHEVLRGELVEMQEMYATPRRTELVESEFETDIEDLIQPEDMVVTVSHTGYIKRVPLTAFRAQRRGGKGRSGMATRDDDFVTQVFVLNTHTPVLFFSSRGMVYKLKVYKLPPGSPTSRGKAMVNLLPLQEGETITTMMPMPEDEETWGDWFVMFATASGNARRNSLSDFVRVQSNGKIAMKLDEGDRLVSVQTANEDQDVLLATRLGRCIRFGVDKVRVFAGRNSTGVRGIRLAKGDEVISMTILGHAEADSTEERDAYLKLARQRRADEDSETEDTGEAPALSDERYEEMAEKEQFLLSVTAKGFGKRSSAYEYRVTGRGGQGVTNMDLGKDVKPDENWVAAVFPVAAGDQIMLVTNSGQTIRCPVADIRIAGRATRGVTIFRIDDDEHVVSVAHLSEDDEDEDELEALAEDADASAPEAGDADDDVVDDDATGATDETEENDKD